MKTYLFPCLFVDYVKVIQLLVEPLILRQIQGRNIFSGPPFAFPKAFPGRCFIKANKKKKTQGEKPLRIHGV